MDRDLGVTCDLVGTFVDRVAVNVNDRGRSGRALNRAAEAQGRSAAHARVPVTSHRYLPKTRQLVMHSGLLRVRAGVKARVSRRIGSEMRSFVTTLARVYESVARRSSCGRAVRMRLGT